MSLLGLLCGEEAAKLAQLMMEYAPAPLFEAGTPETAGKDMVQLLRQLGEPLLEAFGVETRNTAWRLNSRRIL